MTSRRTWSRATAGLTVAALAGAWVSVGCTTSEVCQSGAESATASVEELLAAAVDDDAERACRVSTETASHHLEEHLTDLTALAAESGGLESLVVAELPERQMGSSLVVEVRSARPPMRTEFTVYQSGGRYLVFLGDGSPGDEPSSGEPTTSASQPAVVAP